MKCPHCGYFDSKVINSRAANNENAIRRRRECLQCSKRFTTYETIVEALPVIVKKDGRREDYDRSKLERGIKKAFEKRPVALETIEALIDSVERELFAAEKAEIDSTYIGELVINLLRNADAVAYVRFASVYRQFKDPNDFLTELKHFIEQKK